MFPFAISGVLLSVVWSNTLVAADPQPIVTIDSFEMTNYPNDYFGLWSAEIVKDGDSYYMNGKIPMKKDVPDNMQVKYVITMEGQDPLEFDSNFCEAMTADSLSKSFVDAGVPKDTFPRECPFKAGDWALLKWRPPMEIIPRGIPDGSFSGYVEYSLDGKVPCVKCDFVGQLSHR